MKKIVGKPLLDYMLFVTCTYDELIHAVVGVQLHNVPQNRHSADFNHWFRFELGFLGNSCSVSSCEYNCFQNSASLNSTLTLENRGDSFENNFQVKADRAVFDIANFHCSSACVCSTASAVCRTETRKSRLYAQKHVTVVAVNFSFNLHNGS